MTSCGLITYVVQPTPVSLTLVSVDAYRSHSCQTQATDTKLPTFRVLSVASTGAELLANALCSSSVMASYYSNVEIRWLDRDELSARDILEERYDLFWSRERRVKRLTPDLESYYQVVLKMPEYQVSWYSLTSSPRFTIDYFANHRIGLLDDPESNSHFLLPLGQLKTLGLDLTRTKITYYPNYYQLTEAFQAGEVEVISDGEWLEQTLATPELAKLVIDEHSTMGQWYARVKRPVAIDCALKQALTTMSAQVGSRNQIDNQGVDRPDSQSGDCP